MKKQPDASFYVVAVPEGKVTDKMLKLQKFISRRFKMYTRPYPPLHITVGIIDSTKDIDNALHILQQASFPEIPLNVLIGGSICFEHPHYTVGLKADTPSLSALAGKVEGLLQNGGAPARSLHNWNFHISLINPLFSRMWNKKEFIEACKIADKYAPRDTCKLGRLELWHSSFPPLKVLGRFPREIQV